MTIFGSYIPAREYSLSMWVDGSANKLYLAQSTSYRKRTLLSLIKGKVFPESCCIFSQFRRKLFARCKSIFQFAFPFVCLSFLNFERLRVDVLSTLACLPPELKVLLR